MELNELDLFLRKNTVREKYYLENPGSVSPRYAEMKKDFIDGKEVFYFESPELMNRDISIRKDSRYTFVPFYRFSSVNMNYIYSGECTYLVNDTYLTLHEGDVCIFDKDVIRAKMKLKENDIVFNISMTNDYFNETIRSHISEHSILASFIINSLTQSSHDNFLIFRTDKSEKIISLFNQLLLEYYNERLYHKKIIQSYLDIIFMELLRLYQSDNKNHMIQVSNSSRNKILSILKYIELNYKDCTIGDLSEAFGYHPKYLSMMIKSNTGMNFKEIQLQKRLSMACSYLSNTTYTIQEITEKIGMTNQSYFYKKFVECYHMTPYEYRQQKQ